MGLFRARTLVRSQVVLHAPSRVSARVVAATPEDSPGAGARVLMGVGLVAVAFHRAVGRGRDALGECLVELAVGIAGASDGELPFALVHLGPLGVREYLQVVPWDGDGRGRVDAEVVAAAGGTRVPRVTAAPEYAGPSVEIAALALVASLAEPPDGDVRLALALGVEGVLAWYREADERTPPRDALASALVHAADRMAEAGRVLPAGPA